MSSEAFRSAFQGAIEQWGADQFPGMYICYENGPVPDEDKVGTIWLDCEVRWYGSTFMTMGARPAGRFSGTLSTQVYYREGTGTAAADKVVDSLIELLRARHLGGGLLRMPQRTVSPPMLGWAKAGLLTPFTLDST